MLGLLTARPAVWPVAFVLCALGGGSAPEGGRAVEVLVAGRDLPVGTLLLAADGSWAVKRVARSNAPRAYLTDVADLEGRRAGRAMRAGEPFDPGDPVSGSRGMTWRGPTPVAFTVPADSAAGGYARPGARVDVIATTRAGDGLRALLLLSDVPVLATETAAGGAGTAVTLAVGVTGKQAFALAAAKSRGCRLEVVLRNAEAGPDEGHDLDAVVRLLLAPEVAPAPRPAGRP